MQEYRRVNIHEPIRAHYFVVNLGKSTHPPDLDIHNTQPVDPKMVNEKYNPGIHPLMFVPLRIKTDVQMTKYSQAGVRETIRRDFVIANPTHFPRSTPVHASDLDDGNVQSVPKKFVGEPFCPSIHVACLNPAAKPHT